MARAALETLNIIVGGGLADIACDRGNFALSALEDVRQRHNRLIANPARGQGLMLSMDIEVEGCDAAVNEKLASTIFYRCMENGVILNYPARGTNITLSYPLVSSESDIVEACRVLDATLREFSGQS